MVSPPARCLPAEAGCKVHLGIDAETLHVQAMEDKQARATGPNEPANGSRVGDGLMLPKRLEQIPPEEPIGRSRLTEPMTHAPATPPPQPAEPPP